MRKVLFIFLLTGFYSGSSHAMMYCNAAEVTACKCDGGNACRVEDSGKPFCWDGNGNESACPTDPKSSKPKGPKAKANSTSTRNNIQMNQQSTLNSGGAISTPGGAR